MILLSIGGKEQRENKKAPTNMPGLSRQPVFGDTGQSAQGGRQTGVNHFTHNCLRHSLRLSSN